jgi:hypothetical protein
MTFKVDTLELPITIVIKNPEPKLFVLSGVDSDDPKLKLSLPTNSATSPVVLDFGSKSLEYIKFLDADNFPSNYDSEVGVSSTDKFITSVNGVYTLEMPSTYASATAGLYGRIAIADMPKGVYNFKVVKSYPDGRVETVEDTAEITNHDDNGIAEFGTPTKLNVNNVKFEDKFLIAETEYTLGTYTYDFTFGTINKKYTINVVKQPSLTVSSLSIGTTATQLFDGKYTLKPGTYGGNITMPFTLANLTTANFLSISTATTIASGFTAPLTTKQTLVNLNTVDLGTLTSGARNKNDRIVYTITFFERKAFSEVLNASVADDRFVSIGEPQVITLSFVDSVIPVVTSETLAASFTDQLRLNVTSDLAGTVYALAVEGDLSTEVVAPTAEQIIAQGTTYGSPSITIQGKGTGSVAANTATSIYLAGTGIAAGQVVDVYYVVVGASSISSVKKVNDLTIAAASAKTSMGTLSLATAITGITAPAGHASWRTVRTAAGDLGAMDAVLVKIVLGSTTITELSAQTRLGAANTVAVSAATVVFVTTSGTTLPTIAAAGILESDEFVILSVNADGVILGWASKVATLGS